MKRWYVLNTDKGREQTIEANLALKGYNTYCPMVLKDRRVLTTYATVKPITEPLFPTYLFIQMDDDGDWEGIRVMGERVQILKDRATGYPEPIDDEFIRLLRSRENSQGFHEVAAWRYREGDRVRMKRNIPEGLRGRELIIEAIKDELSKRKVSVAFEFLGRKQVIEVDEQDIEQV